MNRSTRLVAFLHTGYAAIAPAIGAVLVGAASLASGADVETLLQSGAAPTGAPATVLEDAIEPFVPRIERTAEEAEKLEALSRFGAGRMAEAHGDFVEAFRQYQRALRHDPSAVPILWRIVAVSERLGRKSEMLRYALRAVELDPSNPERLRGVAEQLAERGDFEGALKLFDELDRQFEGNRKSPSFVLLTVELGRLRFLNGKSEAAAEAFARVLAALDNPSAYGLTANLQRALTGNRGEYLLLFGEAFLAAGRTADARRAFAKAHQTSPNVALNAYLLSRVLVAEKKHAAALAAIEPYFKAKETAQGTAPYALVAKALRELNRTGELRQRLETLRAADPANVPLQFFLAESLREGDDPAAAEKLLIELADLPAARTRNYNVTGSLMSLYHQTRQYGKLLDLLSEMVGSLEDLQDVGDEAKALADDAEALDAILAEARSRLKTNGANWPASERLSVAILALQAKRFDDASEFFEHVLDAQKDKRRRAEAYGIWAMQALLAERYAEASRLFQRGIDEQVLDRDNWSFHYYLATSLAYEGKTDEALAAAREALDIAEDSVRVESRIPWIMYHGKRYAEAAEAYETLVDKYVDDYSSDEIRSVVREARLVLSNICVTIGDVPRAEEWLEQVLDEYPDDISALNDLGYLWADQGKRLERALAMIQQAVDAEPDNQAFRDSLGWALYRLQRYEEAVAELEKAAADENPDAVILDHLGDAYLANGQLDKAREAWRRAIDGLESAGDPKKLAEVQAKLKKHE